MAADNATTYTRRWCGTGEIAFLTLPSGTRLRYLKVGGRSVALAASHCADAARLFSASHSQIDQLFYGLRSRPSRTWLVGYLARRELRRAIRPHGGGRVRRETRPEGLH